MSPAWRARALAVVIAFIVALPARAYAWVEMHVARDDIRVTIADDGTARVEHKVLLLVSGGPLKSFTIRGVDKDAALEDGARILLEKEDKAGTIENAVPLIVKRIATEDGARTDLVVDIDAGRGIFRGRWVALVRYRTNLIEQGTLAVDGPTARLDWVGPAWDDGLETTRAWFEVPSSPIEPKSVEATGDDEASRGTFLTKLTKRPGLDVLELMRPYAARGEQVTWSVAFDARAVAVARGADPTATDKRAPPKPRARSPLRLVSDVKATLFLVGGVALFFIIAALVAAHALEVRQRAAARDQKARPLVPIPIVLRAVLAGLTFVAGVWLELHEATSLAGAALVALTAPLAWHKNATMKTSLRGPGTWLCVRAEEAFAAARGRPKGAFEPTSIPGMLLMALLVVAFAGAGRWIADRSTYHGVLVALDVVPLLCLFLSGREASLVPDPAVDGIPLLSKIVRLVEAKSKATPRIIPRVRVPQGAADPDELRVIFLPRDPIRGLRAVEVGVAFGAGPGGHVALPEVLVRYEEGSACEALLSTLEPFGRAQRGRKLDERVLTFLPRVPTAATTADLVRAIVERLTAPPSEARPPGEAPPRTKRKAPARALAADDAAPGAASAS